MKKTVIVCDYCGLEEFEACAADLGWRDCAGCGSDICPDCAGPMPEGLCHICYRAETENRAN